MIQDLQDRSLLSKVQRVSNGESLFMTTRDSLSSASMSRNVCSQITTDDDGNRFADPEQELVHQFQRVMRDQQRTDQILQHAFCRHAAHRPPRVQIYYSFRHSSVIRILFVPQILVPLSPDLESALYPPAFQRKLLRTIERKRNLLNSKCILLLLQ